VVAGMMGSSGEAWPPEGHTARLQAYARNAALYLGQHEDVFVKSIYGGDWAGKWRQDASHAYITVNLCGALTRLLSSRLFGEPATVSAPDGEEATQAFIDNLIARDNLRKMHLQAAVTGSYRGDVVLKVYSPDGRTVRVGAVNPACWFPEVSPLNANEIAACNIDQVLSRGEKNYLWRERHELRGGEGWIVNSLFQLSGDARSGYSFDAEKDRRDLSIIPELADPQVTPEEQATGLDSLPIVHIPNIATDEQLYPGLGTTLYGMSDYAGTESLQAELNDRITQEAEVLSEFTIPWVVGPPIQDEKGEIDMRRKYLPTERLDDVNLEMLVWDASLSAVIDAIRSRKQEYAAVTGIDIGALIPPESGGPISGRALKLSQAPTQTVVRSRQMTYGPGLQQIYALATQLANSPMVQFAGDAKPLPLAPQDITVTFQDGLPSDEYEDAQIQTMRLDAGAQELAAALAAMDGLTEAEAQAKADRIAAEMASNLPSPPATLGPPYTQVGPGAGS